MINTIALTYGFAITNLAATFKSPGRTEYLTPTGAFMNVFNRDDQPTTRIMFGHITPDGKRQVTDSITVFNGTTLQHAVNRFTITANGDRWQVNGTNMYLSLSGAMNACGGFKNWL